MSDDGRFALVVIAMLGNPFSPFYAKARARGPARPLDHSCLHVALYGPRRSSWALCEQPVADAARGARELAIGRSRIAFERGALVVDVCEPLAPWRGVVRGRVTLHLDACSSRPVALDRRGHHSWWPLAPFARVEVDLPSPGVRFQGDGYLDANVGATPIESAFSGWTWSRATLRRPGEPVAVAVTYDVAERGAPVVPRDVLFDARGGVLEARGPSPRARLPASAWGLARLAAADRGHTPRLARALTDSPFYARSLVATRLFGRDATAVHEALAADRLRKQWVRFLLGFRMRRRGETGAVAARATPEGR